MTEAPASLLMLNKPKGCVVTRSDEKGRKTVYALLPEWALAEGWVPAGRLDLDSKGLLLFSKGGHDVDALTRPGRLAKTYEVWVRGKVTEEHISKALKGVQTPEGLCRAQSVELLGGAGHKTRLRVTLVEGKNRHIRRLFGALKDPKFGTPLKVLELKRVSIGALALDVPSGKWRFLTPEETSRLLA
ncbi:MAG: rRNA pseudouridine synthase [Elusimicrobia bacterium]|nr:rRNA pseudouridine synthase [Elusimicrobiota bacterium]